MPNLPLYAAFLNEFDFEIGGLRVLVHGWEFPELRGGKTADSEFLIVTAEYRTTGASACATGPIMEARDFNTLLDELQLMNEELRGQASFST